MPYDKKEWHNLNNGVREYIKSYHSDKFKNIFKVYSEKNLGPYLGCKKTMDLCMENSDFAIFMEDDSIVSKDYLVFYESLFNQFLAHDNDAFAGSACSVSPQFSNINKLNSVQKVDWINSTEFGMTREKWEKFGNLRAGQCGDVVLGNAVKANKKYTLMPIVPRMSKIAIGHPDSFSVLNGHSGENIDNIFLPSNDLQIEHLNLGIE
jgi:hypothetical protein